MVDRLQRYFSGRTDVSFAFLYGSHAKGRATNLSDVDIAVYFKPSHGGLDYQADIQYPDEDGTWNQLETITGREIELLVLNRASPNIAASALCGIQLAVQDWGLYADFMLHATMEAAEYRESSLRDFLREA